MHQYMLAHSDMSMMKQSTATKIQRSSFHWVPLQWASFDCGVRWHLCQMMGPTRAHACMAHTCCVYMRYIHFVTLTTPLPLATTVLALSPRKKDFLTFPVVSIFFFDQIYIRKY